MADNYISQILTPSGDSYDIKSKITSAIPYGEVDSTSTATDFTATVPGINALYDGVCMLLRNGRVTSVSGFTLNINNLGAKPVYNNLASGDEVTPKEATRETTIFNINYTMLFIYSTTLVNGGCWICYRGYDANTNTIGYQLRTNSGNLLASDTGYRYRLWFTSADGKKWVPANTSTATDATTSRTMNTRPINPFGPIVYNSTNGTVNSGSRPAVTTLWQQYTLTVGYSYVVSLTAWDPVYVQCTPQTDGSAVMNAIVKALPTSKDGKIYIYLGMAYSTTAIELRTEHPVFYHDGNGIRVWTGADINANAITAVKTSAGVHSAITATSGTASFNVPTKTSHLTNDSGYLTWSDIGAVLRYCGTVDTLELLYMISNPDIGDVYHVTDEGSEWAWFDNEDEAGWEELGSNIDLSAYVTGVTKTTASIGSASTGTAISADDITAWTTNTPTKVSFNNVVTSGTTTSVKPITKKTVVTGTTAANVVTSATMPTATYSSGVLIFTTGSVSTGAAASVTTGDSVTEGTTYSVIASLSTGVAGASTNGTSASLSYTSKTIPNISVTSCNVVTGITVQK